MPARSAHLEATILEQLADGDLPPGEAALARAHLEGCTRCAAELEAYQSLFSALQTLPRFAPSLEFADAVMARVQIRAQESAATAWVRRLVPSTRRGWTLLGVAVTAPATPVLALIALLLTQPLLSPATLWQWAALRSASLTQAGLAWLLESMVSSPLAGWLGTNYTALQAVPIGAVGGALALLGAAIPLSGWALVHLTRNPVEGVSYAE